jgi:hypothetical protein
VATFVRGYAPASDNRRTRALALTVTGGDPSPPPSRQEDQVIRDIKTLDELIERSCDISKRAAASLVRLRQHEGPAVGSAVHRPYVPGAWARRATASDRPAVRPSVTRSLALPVGPTLEQALAWASELKGRYDLIKVELVGARVDWKALLELFRDAKRATDTSSAAGTTAPLA